ncbi:MAG: hypothetical protein ACI4SB_04230 [Acutalibacteraceae bacterium]
MEEAKAEQNKLTYKSKGQGRRALLISEPCTATPSYRHIKLAPTHPTDRYL